MPAIAENIRDLVAVLGAGDDVDAARTVSAGVADLLGWNAGAASARRVKAVDERIQIMRGFVGGQPAAVFVAGEGIADRALLDDAALYAYHASVPWGIVASHSGATVFNSHWIRDNDWFHLPLIRWEDLHTSSDILEAITPDGITNGVIDRLATRVYRPDRFLRPVDDALVDRLDHWRSEVLRHTRGVAGVDAKLQTLFAQLFVLRTVEDRNLAADVPKLSSVLDGNWEANIDKLRKLLESAKTFVGGELFDDDVIEGVPTFVLGGIVHDLYVPQQLPHEGYRYNFAWIDADVLGLAYEKYLSTVLTPAPVAPQLGLFRQPLREVERVSVRKAGGVYYTPAYLTQYLAEQCVSDLVPEGWDAEHIPRIGDFACGSGSFLVAAADALIRRLRAHDPSRNWARELVTGKHIIGIDVDEKAVTMARLNLWTRFTEEPHPLPLPRLAEVIIHGDSLSTDVWENIPSEYDIVLGNPPFLATGHTPDRDDLATRFRTAQGRFDYSYLFVELAVNHLVSGGVMGMVVPNRLFRNRDAGTVRELLTSETDLLAVVDFGSNEVFEGISAYIGTIIAQKRSADTAERAERVRVVNVIDLAPSFIGALLVRAAELGSDLRNDSISAYDVPHPRGEGPWLLLSNAAKRDRTKLEENSDPLPAVAGIYQGIRTGANDIFIVEAEAGSPGTFARIVNGLGDSAIVEEALLHPVVFGSDIQRYDLVTSTRYLLYPYRGGQVIDENSLKEQFPRAYEYLNSYRDILAERSSIKAGGLRWYELVRKRDEAWLSQPKLLIRDLATETSFAADRLGETYLVGGTAVVPMSTDILLPLLAYLNSQAVTQYLSEITPSFRGGFQKFEPQHLQRVPVPRIVIEDADVADQLEGFAGRILVAKSTGDISAQRAGEQAVNDFLASVLANSEST